MASRAKRAEAKEKLKRKRYRTKVLKVMDHFGQQYRKRMPLGEAGERNKDISPGMAIFNAMLVELHKLDLKHLHTLLIQLRSTGYIGPWSGAYHKMLQASIETVIFERTMLK